MENTLRETLPSRIQRSRMKCKLYKGLVIIIKRFKRTGVLRAFVKNKELRWGKTIQYTIGPDLVEFSNTIRSCLDWISQRTCLVFIQGDTGDHIKFTSFGDDDNDGSGCWSYFGRRGGEQAVNLEIPSCLTKDTIFHEVFHALGKVHEQSRPDRDDHVDVLLQNVAEGQADQFEIKKNVDVANTGFDLRSRYKSFLPPKV